MWVDSGRFCTDTSLAGVSVVSLSAAAVVVDLWLWSGTKWRVQDLSVKQYELSCVHL